MQIIIIAAIANNNTIGKDNKLPWHYKEDFQHFKQLTLNHVIVMGRKTFESIGKPLPNRINIVVSRNKDLIIEGCTIAHSLQDAIIFCKKNNVEKIFIIGGSSLFIEGLVIADAMELTLIHKDVEGDVYFPQWDKNQWTEISRENKEEFSFARYEKKNEHKNKCNSHSVYR